MLVIKYKPWKISADSCVSKPPPVCLVACEEGEKRQMSEKGKKGICSSIYLSLCLYYLRISTIRPSVQLIITCILMPDILKP